MSTKRRRITNEQLHRQITLTQRALQLKETKALREGILTQQQVDRFNEEHEQEPEPEQPGVGSTIDWGNDTYRIEAATDDELIVTHVNRWTATTNGT